MADSTIIGFPNLGLGPWEINKFLVHIGSFRIAWYGIFITLGIVFAVWYTCFRSKKEGFTTDDVLDYAIWVVLIGILGARLYYVAMTWDGRYTSFLDIFAIWNGGLAIYGGLIFGGLTILVLSLLKGKSPLKFLDMVCPGVMIAQAMGRWGNFMNGEAYGSILRYEFLGKTFETSRFKGMAIKWIMTLQSTPDAIKTYAHPTFLYESIWNVIGFLLINRIYRKNKKKFDGQVFFSYIIWYGFGRMFIEGFRSDSLYLGNVRISQLVAIGCVLFGIMFYYLLKKRARPVLAAVQDNQAYENLFSAKNVAKTNDKYGNKNSANPEFAAPAKKPEDVPAADNTAKPADEASEKSTADKPEGEN